MPDHPAEFYELIRCAPSTRHFTDQVPPREVLHRVLDNARFAPSGGNRQGWRVIVVTNPEIRRGLRDLYQEPWDAYMIKTGGRAALDAGQDSGLPAGRLRMLRAADEYARTFDRVPVHLVVCVDVNALSITDEALDRPSIVGGASVYPFVQNILLGLRREGLGASFTTLLVPAETEVKRLLNIPEEFIVAGHISTGYRADPWPRRLSRRPVEQFVFAERYGQRW